MKAPYIVGITGGSGSGKTYFLHRLQEYFTVEELCLVSQDNYYKEISEQPLDDQGIENFDLPESIDDHRFYRDLLTLKSGKTVKLYEYTFNNPASVPKLLEFRPAPIMIVEGILVFHFKKIRSLFDLSIFIDAREPVKLVRRINRDARERGYDIDDVLYRYEKHVTPAYEKYLEPLKPEMDLIIPNNNGFDHALQVLISHFKEILSERS